MRIFNCKEILQSEEQPEIGHVRIYFGNSTGGVNVPLKRLLHQDVSLLRIKTACNLLYLRMMII